VTRASGQKIRGTKDDFGVETSRKPETIQSPSREKMGRKQERRKSYSSRGHFSPTELCISGGEGNPESKALESDRD